MKYQRLSRRYFLQGLGGSLMALPLLPSLLPRAHAQAAMNDQFLVLVGADHGGAGFSTDWYPEPFINDFDGAWFTRMQLYAASGANNPEHEIRHAMLNNILRANPGHESGNIDNNQARVSMVLGSFLNPYVNKMNLFAGIDGGMNYYGHSRGVSTGNIYYNDENQDRRWPSVDRFLADSPKFYQNRDILSLPVINMSRWNSWLSNGDQAPNQYSNLSSTYDAIFSRYQGSQDPVEVARRARRSFLIDQVMEDYRRLTRGAYGPARQISSTDRERVERHVAHLTDVQRKFQNLVNTCSDVTGPNERLSYWVPHLETETNVRRLWDMSTDLITAAFQCGASRLAVMQGGIAGLYAGDYHQEIAHAASNSRSAQVTHCENLRFQAQYIVGNMVSKMDAINMGTGQTMLDRGMVAWVHEAGTTTHQHHNIGLTTFGSLGGYFRTGHFVDYRNMNNLGLLANYQAGQSKRPGIPIQRFFANVLQAMGHVPADYRRFGRPGYGDTSVIPTGGTHRANPNGHIPYPTRIVNSLDDKLPIVTT